jgi:hypothetical protein
MPDLTPVWMSLPPSLPAMLPGLLQRSSPAPAMPTPTLPRLLLLLLAAASLTAAPAQAWRDCSTGPSGFKVNDVTLQPKPVNAGDS